MAVVVCIHHNNVIIGTFKKETLIHMSVIKTHIFMNNLSGFIMHFKEI